MLKNILAVITASVSLAACNTPSKERLPQTTKLPSLNNGAGGASNDQPGSQATTALRGATGLSPEG
jgi:hypothetical protein